MFKDLDEFFDPSLQLPIRGKTYVIESPDAKTGLFVQGMMSLAADARAGLDVNPADLQALKLDDDEERDLHKRLLGPVYDEMLADGVRWHQIQHVGHTVIFWVIRGKAFAEAYWNGGGDPKAHPGNPGSGSTASEDPPASPGSSSDPAETKPDAAPGSSSSNAGD